MNARIQAMRAATKRYQQQNADNDLPLTAVTKIILERGLWGSDFGKVYQELETWQQAMPGIVSSELTDSGASAMKQALSDRLIDFSLFNFLPHEEDNSSLLQALCNRVVIRHNQIMGLDRYLPVAIDVAKLDQACIRLAGKVTTLKSKEVHMLLALALPVAELLEPMLATHNGCYRTALPLKAGLLYFELHQLDEPLPSSGSVVTRPAKPGKDKKCEVMGLNKGGIVYNSILISKEFIGRADFSPRDNYLYDSLKSFMAVSAISAALLVRLDLYAIGQLADPMIAATTVAWQEVKDELAEIMQRWHHDHNRRYRVEVPQPARPIVGAKAQPPAFSAETLPPLALGPLRQQIAQYVR